MCKRTKHQSSAGPSVLVCRQFHARCRRRHEARPLEAVDSSSPAGLETCVTHYVRRCHRAMCYAMQIEFIVKYRVSTPPPSPNFPHLRQNQRDDMSTQAIDWTPLKFRMVWIRLVRHVSFVDCPGHVPWICKGKSCERTSPESKMLRQF